MRRIFTAGIFVLAIALFAVFVIRKSTMHDGSKILKVALQGEFPEGQLSPENISTIALYHLHYNLWDNLLAPGENPAVARGFKVSADNLTFTFEIDPEAKFSNGRQITANDVKTAFERIITREENGHINAKSVIRKITAESSGVLKIGLSAPTPSFLFLLTTPEFGIVPIESLNPAGEVTNLTVTSGAYTAARIDVKSQTIRLSRNRFFRRAAQNSPGEVEISFLGALGADVVSKGYDFVEIRSSDAEQIVSVAEKTGFSYKATVPSLSVYMVADTRHLTPDQARFISQAFRENFRFETPRGLEIRSHQFLPEKTFGSLAAQEIPSIPGAGLGPKLPAEIVISNNRSTGPLVEAIQRVFSNVGTKVRIVGLDSKEPVHYMLTAQGMNTDFPEIELHLDTVGPYAFFDASDETKQLVGLTTNESDDAKRSGLIKKIGKEFLATGKVVPLTVRAYVHLYNSSKVDLNNITAYDGDIPFYRLKVPE
jgi:hypothetical protein